MTNKTITLTLTAMQAEQLAAESPTFASILVSLLFTSNEPKTIRDLAKIAVEKRGKENRVGAIIELRKLARENPHCVLASDLNEQGEVNLHRAKSLVDSEMSE